MTTREEAKALYDGQYFYEVKTKVSLFGKKYTVLSGPLDTIRYLSLDAYTGKTLAGTSPMPFIYKFAEIVNGIPVRVFTKDQILITTQKL